MAWPSSECVEYWLGLRVNCLLQQSAVALLKGVYSRAQQQQEQEQQEQEQQQQQQQRQQEQEQEQQELVTRSLRQLSYGSGRAD